MRGSEEMPESIRHLVQKLATTSKKVGNNTGLAITYPYDGAVFPPEIAAPVIAWDDTTAASNHWLIAVEFSSQRSPIYARADKQHWTPDNPIWEAIKANSIHAPAKITVYGFDHKHPGNITAKTASAFPLQKIVLMPQYFTGRFSSRLRSGRRISKR